MRTHYDPTENDEFEVAKNLLVRRCAEWADRQQLTADPFVLAAALDFRHTGIDGRLAFWTTELAGKFLLVWMPRTVSARAEEVSSAPNSLRTLIRYLHHTELIEAGSDHLTDIEAAITDAATEFPQAMSDNGNFGLAKFWAMTAIDSGVDPTDHAAMNRFVERVREDTVEYDSAALQRVTARHIDGDHVSPGQAPMVPPVSLPPEDELAETTENSPLVWRLRELVEWLGRDGRALTDTGRLKLADARELVTRLNTGDTIDPVLGDRTYRTQSSAELTELGLIVAWAKKTRVVRVVKNRLVPIAKARPLLRDSRGLWNKAFDAIVELGDEILEPPRYGPAMPDMFFREIVPDILRSLYGMPEAFPVVRLQESVWLSCGFDDLDESRRGLVRKLTDNEVWRILRALDLLGAVELTTGIAEQTFLADLAEDPTVDDGIGALQAAERGNLSTTPDSGAGPVDLVRLTPPATARVRIWLLDEGRYAPLVGELTEATPAQLLGTIAERHPLEAAREEIDRWLSVHDSDGPERLIDAVRLCPFRSRAPPCSKCWPRTQARARLYCGGCVRITCSGRSRSRTW
ncbi:hypothetical protein SAMN04487904_101510 [Actinopolyspora lacussalsi subsp. righensis]|uniref:Uncharacterized protein n=1 Tax=Actinopolyspora righensis TaxID=995060 RepID=A0A1I6XEH6_9ACTN|nr:hypothetical protein [Actinopolyspora righensis]SFT36577.1 hypothetical protein SAMN04487904_101510 [Actinopolyspora righensis]